MCGWRFPLLDILLLSRIDASDRTNSIRLHIPSNKVVFCISQQCSLKILRKNHVAFPKIFSLLRFRGYGIFIYSGQLDAHDFWLSLVFLSTHAFFSLSAFTFCELLPSKILVGLIPSPFSTLTPLPEQRLLIQTQFCIIVRIRGALYLSLYTMTCSWILPISEPMPTTIARFHLYLFNAMIDTVDQDCCILNIVDLECTIVYVVDLGVKISGSSH